MSAYNAYLYYLIENFLLSSIDIFIGDLQITYYSSSWKSFTYLCSRTCFAVSLLFGLNTSKCFNKSRAYYEAPEKKDSKDFFFGMLVLEIMFDAKGDYID